MGAGGWWSPIPPTPLRFLGALAIQPALAVPAAKEGLARNAAKNRSGLLHAHVAGL